MIPNTEVSALACGVVVAASNVQLPTSYRASHFTTRRRQLAHILPLAGHRIALFDRVQLLAIGTIPACGNREMSNREEKRSRSIECRTVVPVVMRRNLLIVIRSYYPGTKAFGICRCIRSPAKSQKT